MTNNFAKMRLYFNFICKRERFSRIVWAIGLLGSILLFTAVYPTLVSTEEEIQQLAFTMTNPAMVAMMGPVYGMESLTQASVMAQECLVWFCIAVAIMNIFLVNRHTRVDEELGRLEMFRALPVGRLTGNCSTIFYAFFLNLTIALLSTTCILALNIGGTTHSGALVYGMALGAFGFMFAGLTLLAAQCFSTSRGVTGCSFSLLGIFYIMRALGDVNDNVLSLISPLGLALKVEAFYADDFLPVAVLVLEGILLAVIALILCSRRDHGCGLFPARKGAVRASRFLRSPLGFSWRVSRGTFLGWSIGLFVLAAAYGSICGSINDFVEGNEMIKKMLEANSSNTLLDNYVAMIFSIMSMIVSIPVILTAAHIRSEEKRGRLDQLIARAVPRGKLYGSFLVIGFAESIVLELLMALGLWISSGGQLEFLRLIQAGFSYLPAVWVMMGLTVLFIGAAPRLMVLVWALFTYEFCIMYLGRLADLPQWSMKMTPFSNIPQFPVEEFSILPLLILTAIAAAFIILGMERFKRRDLA